MMAPQPWLRWYVGKDFSNDWCTHNISTWMDVLGPLKNQALDILEVGSWEGRSAIAFLEILPKSNITCIDKFAGEPIDPSYHVNRDQLLRKETAFDKNMAPYGNRVTKMKGRAAAMLDVVRLQGRMFDLIYIDAEHSRRDVLADSVMAWHLLRVGGLMIWDDAGDFNGPASARAPDALMMFTTMFRSCLDTLHHNWQLIARKSAEWPDEFIEPRPSQLEAVTRPRK